MSKGTVVKTLNLDSHVDQEKNTKISREKFLEMKYSEIPEDKKHFKI